MAYGKTIRRTKVYRLFEGTLQARGCFAVTRVSDGAQTYWDTGSEGHEHAYRLRRLSDCEFNRACASMEFHP